MAILCLESVSLAGARLSRLTRLCWPKTAWKQEFLLTAMRICCQDWITSNLVPGSPTSSMSQLLSFLPMLYCRSAS